MILIVGGAYQGKKNYAMQRFSLCENDVYTCSGTYIDFTKPCIYALEEFSLACILENVDPVELLKAHQQEFQDSIFICQDIFCGVVPMERHMRLWRDATGKLCQYLSSQSEGVYRIFCGLEQRLK